MLFLLAFVVFLFACQPAVKKEKEEPSYSAFPQFLKKPSFPVDEETFRRSLFMKDEAQELCSSGEEEVKEKVKKLSSRFPTLKSYAGDWRKGEALALPPETYKRLYGKRGGDKRAMCYACHCGDPRVEECGNVGPSLRFYAKKGVKPKELFKRLYNPWSFIPCSPMPRFGYHRLLTPEEITHLVAYLLSPESPLNAPEVKP